jgi:hypothetical protein
VLKKGITMTHIKQEFDVCHSKKLLIGAVPSEINLIVRKARKIGASGLGGKAGLSQIS